jgi:hypothetical protein
MRLRRTSLHPCSLERLASAPAQPALFHHLASPMLIFESVEPADDMDQWSPADFAH